MTHRHEVTGWCTRRGGLACQEGRLKAVHQPMRQRWMLKFVPITPVTFSSRHLFQSGHSTEVDIGRIVSVAFRWADLVLAFRLFRHSI
jgi:hypothetical protein